MKELRDFDLNLLVALEALLSEGSVTGAAKRLSRGQPAASHALRRLRELFGDPLLVRDGNEMRLTPRAEALRDELEPVLREDLVPHHLVAPRVVAATDAILTATSRLAPELLALARLHVLAPPVEVADYAVSVVWHERTHAEPGARWLRALGREVVSELEEGAT